MSAKALALAALLLAGAPAAHAATAPAPADPVAARAILSACEGKDSFSDPAPAARIYGNVWYVGTCTVSAILLTSPQGNVLIDAVTEQAAPSILANIRAAGVDPRTIRWIVTSHEHFDHVGGLATLQRATGAKIAALRAGLPALTSGKTSPADPQAGHIDPFAPVRVDRVLRDGEVLRVGPLALTALATPGHTEGSTSWRWTSCGGNAGCQRFTYVDSLTALPLGSYRFADHPDRVAMFRRTFARVRAWDCGILLTPHPSASDLIERMAGQASLRDPGACRVLVDGAQDRLNKALKDTTPRP
jgi:metallo-beta-lactamase class B